MNHFKHTDVPRDECIRYRNYYLRKNYINLIRLINPMEAQFLENGLSDHIKAFCERHNN